MLLLSLNNFNDCCEISCYDVRFTRTASESEFPNLKKTYQVAL